jgi:hypothetical protein
MSVLQNPVRRWPFAVQVGLNRFFLFRWFDYRQRTCVLPVIEIRCDYDLAPLDPAAWASAISKYFSAFSDPSLGGANHPKPTVRRIGIRQLIHWSLGKTKNN